MIAIPKRAVPHTNYQVRRRRYDGAPWLVHHNDWFALDELSDLVWRGCEATLPVEAIVRRVAREGSVSLADALAATAYALARFRELGLVSWDESERA